jgi:DNA uptake protein ComE-like DNA-binding protein
MKLTALKSQSCVSRRASVLIIVLWIAFGLVSVALYFAHSMGFELRSADNRVAGLEADQAIDGAARYAAYILTLQQQQQPGVIPLPTSYQAEQLLVGDAICWFIGRTDQVVRTQPGLPSFGLVDEASKLNLNTVDYTNLQLLPFITPEFAAAIVDWRDTNSDVTVGGAENETYMRLKPPYACKNAAFESVDELRLVFGSDLELLYGEDANLNGVLDVNENDGDVSLPWDNHDGQLDAGLFEYLTVSTREPVNRTNGLPRINVTDTSATNRQQLATLFSDKFSASRAQEILNALPAAQPIRSVLEFYIQSGMKPEEFSLLESEVRGASLEGLVNINSASAAVLACIPGIGTTNAPSLVAYRQANAASSTSLAWASQVLDRNSAIQAGPYLTGLSYQFSADIAAVGHYGRGYRRVRFVFDVSDGVAKIISRQDLSDLGWALGRDVHQQLLALQDKRR